MKIALPVVSRKPNSQAHPFPIQIALQTQEFIQAVLFHTAFMDIASGEFVRMPDGVKRVEEILRARGLEDSVYSQAWELMRKYQVVFDTYVFQSVLIAFNSHWDWYIRKLAEFIRASRLKIGGHSLSKEDEKRLTRVDRLPLPEQLALIELTIGTNLPLSEAERQELKEMSLVRNLGLHNRWEIDTIYMKETSKTGFQTGDLRIVNIEELLKWQALLIKLLNSSSVECAKRFNTAPDFPM